MAKQLLIKDVESLAYETRANQQYHHIDECHRLIREMIGYLELHHK